MSNMESRQLVEMSCIAERQAFFDTYPEMVSTSFFLVLIILFEKSFLDDPPLLLEAYSNNT